MIVKWILDNPDNFLVFLIVLGAPLVYIFVVFARCMIMVLEEQEIRQRGDRAALCEFLRTKKTMRHIFGLGLL